MFNFRSRRAIGNRAPGMGSLLPTPWVRQKLRNALWPSWVFCFGGDCLALPMFGAFRIPSESAGAPVHSQITLARGMGRLYIFFLSGYFIASAKPGEDKGVGFFPVADHCGKGCQPIGSSYSRSPFPQRLWKKLDSVRGVTVCLSEQFARTDCPSGS